MHFVAPQRIGILSLQRLGDVLTARRVTEALSMRRDTGRIELIHFEATGQAAKLLPGVDACHALSFNGLRQLKRCNPISALAGLRGRLEEIRSGGFDRIINLTSTRFSCLIGPSLVASGGSIDGPWIDDAGRYRSNHPAISYLDDWGVDPDINVFAHHDLYTLGARARLAGYRGLGLPERSAPIEDRPIALHIHGSEAAKNWRAPTDPQGWGALITGIRNEFRCPVVLLGAPSEAEVLGRLAETTGAELYLRRLDETAEFLRGCTGLISVDTVAIHLAAAVNCPTIVLRDGPARGHAFIPGSQALLVDSAQSATAQDVQRLASKFLFEQDLPSDHAVDLAFRLTVREARVDTLGHLGLWTPGWLPVSFAVRDADDMADSWRFAWRNSFDEIPIPATVLHTLEHPKSELDEQRLRRALGSRMPLGRTLQGRTLVPGRAA